MGVVKLVRAKADLKQSGYSPTTKFT